MPVQEPGVRPARPLPYAFDVTGRVGSGDGRYWLDFANTGAAGASFHVYSGNRSDGPWTYTLAAGTTLSDYWSVDAVTDGVYALSVYGPNGFLRAFAGDFDAAVAGGPASPEIALSYDAPSEGLVLHITNHGASSCVLTLRALRYADDAPQAIALDGGQTIDVPWPLGASAHWYDFVLTSDHDKWFERRLAGHVETGAPSTSDPAYGEQPQQRIFADGFEPAMR